MLGKNFNEGSIWRRWDLHIHTPETKKNDHFLGANPEEKWQKYADSINAYPDEISVIGITDYLCTDNYFKFKKLIGSGVIQNRFHLIIPNVELRITPVTGNSTPINIHCLFNPEFESKLEKRFFSELKINHSGSSRKYSAHKTDLIELGRKYTNNDLLDEQAALKEGINQFVIPFDTLKSIFDSDLELRLNTVIIVSNKSTDGASGLAAHFELLEGQKYSALDVTRQNIYHFADAIFSPNEKDIKYFLGLGPDSIDEVKRKCSSLKPCFHGSDAHENSKIFEPDLKRYCWVKADPTFEGLKQVLYEPEERVQIRETNPDAMFDKPVFSLVSISEKLKALDDIESKLHFTKGNIPLNRGLVSIIGGRGQGKSMLVNYLGHGLSKEINGKLRTRINLNDTFAIEWKQSNTSLSKAFTLGAQKELPFTFIFQSKVKELADDNELLKKEIIEMLKGAGFEKPQNKVNEIRIKETFQNYWNLINWLAKTDKEGALLNDKEKIKKRIESVQENINLVTEGSNKSLLEQYVNNVKELEDLAKEQENIRQLRKSLINSRETINTLLSNFPSVTPVDTTQQQRDILKLYRENLRKSLELKDRNTKIKDENFKDFAGDLAQLLLNLTNYQKDISELGQNLKDIETKEAELLIAKNEINKIIAQLKENLLAEAQSITKTWELKIFDNPERGAAENQLIKKILADKDIKIEGVVSFNANQFFTSAEKFIDGRALKPKTKDKVFEILGINSSSGTTNEILDYSIERLEAARQANPTCFYEGMENDLLKVFIEPDYRNNFIHVFPNITVGNRKLIDLSAGQKGTVYLCLKLATQLFSGPIIFDQPEDDLDNEFITNQLTDLFKEIKKYRQVIIVSHNANLVVNADSEQVVIAKNDCEELQYVSGALENGEINKEICRILEGGEEAFEKRRDKYRYLK